MNVEKLLQFCVSRLVDNPDALQISHRTADEKIVFEVRVAPTDLARVIGKEGRTFKALKALINLPQPGVPHDLIVDSI
jgi:predicted RNA-binding protein YlqC (UPF0109 family)